MHITKNKAYSAAQCVICKNNSFFLKTVNTHNIFKCENCRLEFTHPMPSEKTLSHFYSQYIDIRAQDQVTKKNALHNLDFLRKEYSIQKDQKILDYGCGNNMFVHVCQENGFQHSVGYDKFINDENEKHIISQLNNEKKWDAITLWGVLEHLTEPEKELSALKEILKKDGVIILTTINIDGAIPYQLKPPEHTLYFSRHSIELLAENAGLKVLAMDDYYMEQDSNVYLSILLRTMPEHYKKLIHHNMPAFVHIPTNETRVVLSLI